MCAHADSPPVPVKIGLMGGIGCGKSTVAQMFGELGATVMDADHAAQEALDEPDVVAAVKQRWGEAVLGEDGRVERRKLAGHVFADTADAEEDRRFLERLIHPRVRSKLDCQLAELAHHDAPAVVLDVPLLLEAGWDSLCDHLLFVDAPREQRLKRVRGRGWADSELRQREATQLPVATKQSRADAVIDNSDSLSRTRAQVEAIWTRWVGSR